MIPAFLIERDTVTIKRAVEGSQDSTGGRNTTYTTAARGSSPTSWACTALHMTVDEETRYGVRGDRQLWKFIGSTDPAVDTRDQIEFTDAGGSSHTVKVLGRARNLANTDEAYQVNGEEVSNES